MPKDRLSKETDLVLNTMAEIENEGNSNFDLEILQKLLKLQKVF